VIDWSELATGPLSTRLEGDILLSHVCPKCGSEHLRASNGTFLNLAGSTAVCPHCHHFLDPMLKPLISLKDLIVQAEYKLSGQCPKCEQFVNTNGQPVQPVLHTMWCEDATFEIIEVSRSQIIVYQECYPLNFKSYFQEQLGTVFFLESRIKTGTVKFQELFSRTIGYR